LLSDGAFKEIGTVIEEQTVEKWDRVIGVNLRGTYLCSRRAGQWMASHKTGSIVNISSIGGIAATPSMSSYGASKAGIIHLTRCLALELAQYNIRVNCVAPGLIDTPLTQRTIARQSTPEQISQGIPLARMGESEEIAKAALFLVSTPVTSQE